MSPGGELSVIMPVINAPFRIYYAYNPLRLYERPYCNTVPWEATRQSCTSQLITRDLFPPGGAGDYTYAESWPATERVICSASRAKPSALPSLRLSKGVLIQMKRSLAMMTLLASGFCLSAAAQTSSAPAAPAGPAKVAVFSFQAAVGQTNEFQRDMADLEKKYEPRRQQIKTMADEIDTLDKQLKSQGEKLSEAERTHRAKSIEKRKSRGSAWPRICRMTSRERCRKSSVK